MSDYTLSPSSPTPRRPRLRRTLFVLVVLVLGWYAAKGASRVGNATITVINRIAGHPGAGNADIANTLPRIADDPEYAMPDNGKDRLDILLLGIRGKDDVENGGLLTDTAMLLSLDTKTGTAALTSIPRDLTVRVTDTKTEKINTAYTYNGIAGTKRLYSRILGVGIDNVVVFDFDAFKYIVEQLGGITITLDKPFQETQQWGYTFSLPAGTDTLNGDQALYYVRSRYGSSDFDRARRQQQVIMAMKAKVADLHLTRNPLKALELVTTVRKHIETDLNIFDLGTIKDLIGAGDQLSQVRHYQLTTENLLYETTAGGTYVLLPRDSTLAHIKAFLRTVLSGRPVLPTPAPTESSPRATHL